VIAHEVGRHFDKNTTSHIAATIRSAIAKEDELLVYAVAFVQSGRLPKTSSGKVDYPALRHKEGL